MKQHLTPSLATALVLALANALLGGGVLAADASSSIIQTKNFIDTISGYTDLSTCAENVLSTVVRAEYSGCGDTYAVTSYTCFCTDSSSFMSSVISSDVSASCPASVAAAQASSALGVFDAYCELGVAAGLSGARTTQGESTFSCPPPGGVGLGAAELKHRGTVRRLTGCCSRKLPNYHGIGVVIIEYSESSRQRWAGHRYRDRHGDADKRRVFVGDLLLLLGSV